MDFKKSQAAHLAERANALNLQPLLDAVICYCGTTQTRRHLTEIYFHFVQLLATSDFDNRAFTDALFTLHQIIEAVDLMEEPGEKLLEIKAV